MRFLEGNNDGEFSLTKDFGDDTPRYAILSHTWGEDEVTFKNMMECTGKSKAGYDKIRFCREQAERDGLQYFWVDTCCIDKSNNTELSEAINSMFRWYQNATKCYVYLSDVSITKRNTGSESSKFIWEPSFQVSRWFTRGWTLQELLAPASVEFFSREGKRLGDKRTMEEQIHKITEIAVSALQGVSLSQFGIDERLSWAEKRQTMRQEDAAYSLLGIFNLYMPLIYGEGKENALMRLREEINKSSKGLDRLPCAVEAPFNSYTTQHSPTCLPNTRVELLRDIYVWADGQDERCIFWLNGLAGTGKSTIARTIARRYSDQKALGASFFFSRGGGDVSHAGMFVTSIAAQVARSIPTLRRYISSVVTEYSDIANRSLRDQWQLLVLAPLAQLDSNSCRASYILVVDALDECDNGDNIRIILQLLAEARCLKRVRLRIFITSRPEIPIRYSIQDIPEAGHQDFILHNIAQKIVDADISRFLEYNLNIIRRECNIAVDWPGAQNIRWLVKHANGLFIWAATACRFIQEGKRFATKRLAMILESSSTSVTAPARHLDEIYVTVISHSISTDFTDEEKEEWYSILRLILGSIVILFSPLSTDSLSRLLDTTKRDIEQSLEDLHAILDIPKDPVSLLCLHHPSFRDFLLDKERCTNPKFWVDKRKAHQILADSCIRLMSNYLKQDICRQKAPGTLVAHVERSQIEQCLPPEVRYACLYWVQHLQKSGAQLYKNNQIYQFLQVHFLHWLEALSWIGKSSEGVLAISSLEAQTFANGNPDLYAFIHDAKRFALYYRSIIEQAPLQVYCSTLVFTPEESIIWRQFEKHFPPWIQTKPKVQASWNATLLTLEGHTGPVLSVTFSPNGQQLASASSDETVRLWDTATGTLQQTLKGHTDSVQSVAFSPNSQQLASASSDETVRLWDTATGNLQQTLKGHTSSVWSVAFSPNSQQLASASFDKTVRLWDTATGTLQQTLKGHTNWVQSVAFSPNSQQLASASSDKTVRLWDTATGTLQQTLKGHTSSVQSVTFSPNSQQLASASFDDTVRLWDTATGTLQQTLKGHTSLVWSVAFSPNSRQLASASSDKTVRLWDTATGTLQQTLKGHTDSVQSVTFSPNSQQLASASSDKTVRLWDTAAGTLQQTLKGHTSSVQSVTFSPNSQQLASASFDDIVRLWDTATGTLQQTLKGHTSLVWSVAFSPNSQQFASALSDKTVRLWDTATGTLQQTLKGHTDSVQSVAFSPNSQQLASASSDETVRLWDTATGTLQQTLKGHTSSVQSVTFSPNSQQLASASFDKTVRLWDTATGNLQQTLTGHTDWVWSVVFSPNSRQLASASSDETVRLWDTATGTLQQTLKGHTDSVQSVTFSPNSQQLASASFDKTVRLWDTATGTLQQTLEGHTDYVTFSSDGGSNIITDFGTFNVSQLSSQFNQTGKSINYGINSNATWITWNGSNVLWLPPDCRMSKFAIQENCIGISCSSGLVYILNFSPDVMPFT